MSEIMGQVSPRARAQGIPQSGDPVSRSAARGRLLRELMTVTATNLHRQALANLLLVGFALLATAGLLTAAALAPAPTAVQPVLSVVCVCFAAVMASSAPASVAVLRSSRDAVGRMRRQLAELPEAEHPLGL
jgi:hypothetical protein